MDETWIFRKLDLYPVVTILLTRNVRLTDIAVGYVPDWRNVLSDGRQAKEVSVQE